MINTLHVIVTCTVSYHDYLTLTQHNRMASDNHVGLSLCILSSAKVIFNPSHQSDYILAGFSQNLAVKLSTLYTVYELGNFGDANFCNDLTAVLKFSSSNFS